MNGQHRILILCIGSVLSAGLSLHGFVQTNFFRTDDQFWHLPPVAQSDFRCGLNIEGGGKRTGLDAQGCRKNVLALHDDYQDVIAMLLNQKDPLINQRTTNLFGNTLNTVGRTSDFGDVQLTGRFEELDVTPFFRYRLPYKSGFGKFYLHAFLPFKANKITGVTIKPATQGTAFAFGGGGNGPLEELITQLCPDLSRLTQELSGLGLASVNKAGMGDFHLLFELEKKCGKLAENIKNVSLFAKVGFSIPTANKKHEDRAFSIPLGYDGAWSIPFGFAVSAEPIRYLRLGLTADFLHIFDDTRTRRLKVDPEPPFPPLPVVQPAFPPTVAAPSGSQQNAEQSEFLLLNKGRVTRRHGLTWQFMPFAEIHRYNDAVSLRLAYQFMRHEGDHLNAQDSRFDNNTINQAGYLKSWYVHNIILQSTFDLIRGADADSVAGAPQFSFFAKVPITGRNIIDTSTVGGQISFNF